MVTYSSALERSVYGSGCRLVGNVKKAYYEDKDADK